MGPLGPLWSPRGPSEPKSGQIRPGWGCPFSKNSPKFAFFAFLGSRIVVLGSKMADPSSVSTKGRCLRQTPPQKSDFWDFQARFRPGGAAFGKHLPRNPTFATHTVSLCGNHTEPAGGRWRRAVAPTQTPLVSPHPPKIAIPLLGGTSVTCPHGHPPAGGMGGNGGNMARNGGEMAPWV